MPMISTLPQTWSSPVTLAADEVWQVRGGPVFLTTEASPAPLTGLEMRSGDAIRVTAGKTVRYRSFDATAQIVREVV